MGKRIDYAKHHIDDTDIKNIVSSLKNNQLSNGPNINLFEKKIATKFKCKYTSVVSSGTAALHLIGKALEWKENDLILTTPLTFVATSNSIIYSGAKPYFIDINNDTFTINLNILEDKLKKLNSNKKKVKTVIGVDYAGHPCDWIGLKFLSNKYEFSLVNDNCHALGSKINNDIGYASKYADIVSHSYHASKTITSGEGGAVLTNSKILDKKIKTFRNHGLNRDLKKHWIYKMDDIGFNYRMTDFQAALGVSQLKKLEKFVKWQRKCAKIYNKIFKNSELYSRPIEFNKYKHSYHFYPLQIKKIKNLIDKNNFMNHLVSKNIYLQSHYTPISNYDYYKNRYNYSIKSYPNTFNFFIREVSLPTYAYIEDEKIEKIYNTINNYLT